VGACLDQGGVGCGGGLQAVLGRGVREMCGEEALVGEAGEERVAELVEIREVGEQREVFRADLAETEAGIEDDGLRGDAGGVGEREGVGEAAQDEREDLIRGERRERGPLCRGCASGWRRAFLWRGARPSGGPRGGRRRR